MDVERVPASLLAERAAAWMADEMRAAVAERGVGHVAVSGGSTPAAMFKALAALDLPWEQVHVWQVDERGAPEGDADRNAEQLHVLPGVLHLMPVTDPDLASAARAYEEQLQEAGASTLDIVHLGLGDDGHTASWPPGRVPEGPGDVAVVPGFRGHDRLTLTPAPIGRARARMFLVAGDGKAPVLARLLAGDDSLPASLVPPEGTTVLTDIDA